ncbi:hypothetical protein L914_08386 [Phytophthora nicotianae]|uniref:HAT C-terminal dimerisation domain-containing protein n=3 Tax=Phytophthora nicotianae TaxID=4792 RepID=V9F663_PHYNI|nr:hypothetical protein F443_08673 [Phytophthora nicotianae P1569]ETM46771.1 hypothetical protein L914_08386 [Phytophthora nicotianae]
MTELMISVVKAQNVRVPVVVEEPSPVSVTQTLFSEESMDCFGDLIQEGLAVPDAAEDLEGARVDEEMERWETTPASIQLRGDRPETILEFWQRQAASNTYTFLPQVVRILFAIPTSSAQIERDFGTAGQLVTPQRGSIAPYNVDMSAFLNCNWQFVDVTQCLSIRERDISSYIPSHVKVGLEDNDTEGCELLSGYFSAESDDEDDEIDVTGIC